jgi:hexosaminidase
MLLISLILLFKLSSCSLSQMGLIPRPRTIIDSNDCPFILSPSSKIWIPHHQNIYSALLPSISIINSALKEYFGSELEIHRYDDGSMESEHRIQDIINDIFLQIEFSENRNPVRESSYKILISEKSLRIEVHRPIGAFYAAQTLAQIISSTSVKFESSSEKQKRINDTFSKPFFSSINQLDSESDSSKQNISALTSNHVKIPAGTIIDRPRYLWRGLMIDVARHFFTVETIFQVIDLASRYKINKIHLHLSDDQGFRLEIEKWPRLTSIGAQSAVGGGAGGYYTQEDYKRIVKYASARYITIVPEFDLPGHSHAMIAAYPFLRGINSQIPGGEVKRVGTAKDDIPLYTGIDVGFSCIDLSSERTISFVKDIFEEVSTISPGRYIHLGGDEGFACPRADGSFSKFIGRISNIIRSLGKVPIGWQETAGHGPTYQQLWNTGGGHSSGDTKTPTIFSPASKTYLDQKYDYHSNTPGLSWAGPVSLRQAYEWDPSDFSNRPTVGIEAALWTETVDTVEKLFLMLLPRLAAVAEVAWSDPSQKSFSSFCRRIVSEGRRWSDLGITFFRSNEVSWK